MSRGNDPRRRARVSLVWALILFALVQVAGSLLLDYRWPNLRFPSSVLAMNRLREKPSPEIVFVGSSRFGCGIQENEIEQLMHSTRRPGLACSVVNASVPAGDAVAEEYMLRRLLCSGVRPRLVVVEVMPENLNRANDWYTIHVRRQLGWEDVPCYFTEIVQSGNLGRFLSARFLALHLHRREVRNALLTALRNDRPAPVESQAAVVPSDPIDWHKVLQPPHVEMTPQVAEILRTTDGPARLLRNFRIGGNCPARLEHILTMGRQYGFQVLLVSPPVSRPHRRAYTMAIEKEFHDYLTGLQQRFGCGYVDCRDWLDDSLFVDNHHQHPEGARYFSRLLTYRVLGPLWQDVVARR